MTILILGRNGQVAWELRRSLASLGNVISLDRHTVPAVDLQKPSEIKSVIKQVNPSLVINAAAYTAVDLAEKEIHVAMLVNAEATAAIAEAVAEVGAMLIHYSTDYVFSGEGSKPYTENDAVSPQSVYGNSKLAGEKAITDSGCHHMILRTAWVYGSRGKNFLLTMLRLMREREELGVVNDQIGAPTWSRLIAEATALICAQCVYHGQFLPKNGNGIYHLTSQGQTSWHGFALKIMAKGLEIGLLPDSKKLLEIKGITTDQYPTPAKRPTYSVLSGEKLSDDYNVQLPQWDDALELCMDEILV